MLHSEYKFIKYLKTTIDRVLLNCEIFKIVINADRKFANTFRDCYIIPNFGVVALVNIIGKQF